MPKKPLQKARENRSSDKKDLTFHPYHITPETAHTAVLLLESEEDEILCQTLRAITKFSAQDTRNREILFQLDAIKYILPHIKHIALNVQRFALKALAQLCQLPTAPEVVLVDAENVRTVAALLGKMEDVYVLEFASLILAELTREPLGCDQLVATNVISTLFNRMKSSADPDVQKNCLQTISNLLDDPASASEVTMNPHCTWPPILALMKNKYVAIQHAAIKTVGQLLGRFKDEHIQKSFKASTGISDFCDILETYDFRDIHSLILDVIRDYVETEDNAAHAHRAGALQRLLAYLEIAPVELKPRALAALAKMTLTESGRKALFETGADLVFCHLLLGSDVELLADAALAAGNMARLAEAAVRMCEAGVVEALASILADERAAWFDVRINALKALGELTRATPRAATALVAPKTFSAVLNVNKKYKETPVEAQRLAVQCYINLLDYHETMRALLTPHFIQELLNIVQRIDIKLKILACSALSVLMSEDPGRQLFTSKGGEKVVSENLKVEHLGLRTALCNLILASVTTAGAEVYHGIGTLHYMVTNRQARYAVSAWEAALESIFKHNPSAKFAYTGRLDVTDFTHDGFYVQKRISDRFPPLKDIVRDARRPFKDPVLVINFGNSKHASEPSHERSSSDSKVDSNLRNYLDNLLSWFGEPESSCKGSKSMQYTEVDESEYEVRYREKCHEVSTTLKSRAEQLAQFVVEQMCGLTEERDCSMPSVDLHLADLMLDLNTSVLPLGHVRCGGSLERALLYKALADRIAVPCALCRGGGGAWCEVAVPENDPNEDEIIPGPALRGYPAGLLRVNYIVDLERGRLVRAGGADAQRVCGVTCSQRYVSGKSPDECYCDVLFYV